MRNFLRLLVISVLFFGCGSSDDNVKETLFEGSWYPRGEEVEKVLEKYVSSASTATIKGEIIGLVLPHAGWSFALPVAAEGISVLKGKKFDTVFILGPSHHIAMEGAALWNYSFWETPLGQVPVDLKIVNRLAEEKSFVMSEVPFLKEHSIEVVLPYLKYALGNFNFVGIVVGQDLRNYASIGKAIATDTPGKSLFVASSDMSHYLKWEDALKMDGKCLDYLKNFDIQGLEKALASGEVQLCGAGSVLAVMEASKLKGANAVQVLKYATSAEVSGDKSRVVGYSAVCFYRKEAEMLNEAEKKELLKIARKTIESFVRRKEIPEFDITSPRLNEIQGAFVTLHKGGMLRGCIGNIVGTKPLWQVVRDMAIASATEDPRFEPVKPDELKDIEIEISVLSPLKKVTPDEIVPGRDGVVVKKGFHQGVYLPQVAEEEGWSKEEFLSSLCQHKAGLPPDAWQDPSTELFSFEAQVFSEKGDGPN